MSEPITISIQELAALLKRADSPVMFYNLPRGGDQYHRTIEIRFYEQTPDDVELEFRMMVNMATVSTVRHKLGDLFLLLPRLATFLMEQEAKQ